MSRKGSSIKFLLDSRVYSKNSIVKCLYWYTKDFQISIDIKDQYFFDIQIESNSDFTDQQLAAIERKLKQEFIDYNLRDIVKKETNTIRELIIAKAFSHGEYDEDPKGDLMDPLGIKFL